MNISFNFKSSILGNRLAPVSLKSWNTRNRNLKPLRHLFSLHSFGMETQSQKGVDPRTAGYSNFFFALKNFFCFKFKYS